VLEIMTDRIVIVGAGQAGIQAVMTLRAEGFTGAITMVGEEAYPPYQRPPLSKAYLLGQFQRERLFLKPDDYYEPKNCQLLLNTVVDKIDSSAKTVTFRDGKSLGYDKLLIATGTRVRRIPVPGETLSGIHYLRSIADVDSLQAVFKPGKKLAVVGGGYIGLEVAAVAAKSGIDVTVFEAMDRLMARAVSPEVSTFYQDEHRKAGVKLLLNTGVEAFEGSPHVGDGKVERVRAGGKSYDADVVLVGIGVHPNVELALAAGVECRDGILVDDNARTSNPDIYAAGDCTRHTGWDEQSIRLECVQNAIDQAKHAALAMLGKPKTYREVPWFWSDQYDLKMQCAGLIRPGDVAVFRGDLAARKFAIFHLRDGKVAAVEAVNAAQEYLVGRKMIAARSAPDPAKLADASIPMKTFAP